MSTTALPTPTASSWFNIALLGFVWGGTFMVMAIALEGYPPMTVACARTVLGALGLLALLPLTGRKIPKITPSLARSILWIGLFSTAIPFVLLSWGLSHVPSAFAGVSMAAVPLFVLPLAHFFSDEKLIPRRLIGVLIGFCGALVLIGPGLANLGQGNEPLAQVACLTAALCYAISSTATRRCPPIDPMVLSALSLLVGAMPLVPLMLLIDGVPSWEGARAGGAILFLGLIPTAAATLLRIQVIQTAGSVFMTLVNYQVPIWSMVFGAVVLSEELPLRFYVALVLVLIGLAVSQWNSLRRLFQSA
ncbi:drug/metabolite transporter (DMT)-like permease [Shimia isoporae]|uniref:Drug/metabolite transporter (DMT)-like permease n=1 Tax=Shimia isoporae TaxID=647720 RepID=A0A4R1NUC2_9RHOB|nr:DMT family transporter [Shimia isoporae]TCL08632.1 drug/metabolite transporter (DMT)-like permease [Shimia isoporae]